MNPEAKKILIVEDSVFMRKILTDLLTEAGYDVIGEAVDGEEGMELANSLKPDLVTLDLILPDVTGFEVLKDIKQHNPNIPVLMITSVGEECVQDELLSLGATDIITKPFDEISVIKKLDKIFAN